MTEEFIEVSTGAESIRIGFTDQKISGLAGLSTKQIREEAPDYGQ